MASTPEDLAGALRWRYATKSFQAGAASRYRSEPSCLNRPV
jgi:hypothetical protein